MVRIEDKKLIIEMITGTEGQTDIVNLQDALLYLLRVQQPELVNHEVNVIVLDFLAEIMFNPDQVTI